MIYLIFLKDLINIVSVTDVVHDEIVSTKMGLMENFMYLIIYFKM